MTSLNRASLIGNLGADPEIRRLNDGRPVATFRVATSETWTDKDTKEKRERTEWHSVVVFSEGLINAVIEKYCRKGTKVFVEGQLQTRKWQGQDGVDRYTTEIVLRGMGSTLHLLGGSGARPPAPAEDGYGAQREEPAPAAGYARGAMDDDIPFAPEVR